MRTGRRAVSRRAGWALAGTAGLVWLASGSVWAVVDTSEPPGFDPVETTIVEESAPEPTEAAAPTEPAETSPPSEPPETTTESTELDATVPTSEPVPDTEPSVDTEPALDSEPPAGTDAPESSEAPPSSVATDCTATVDGDGPVQLPDGCAVRGLPAAAANPPVGPACGLSVTIVVDRSASTDGGAARRAIAAIVDGLVDTGSTVALVDFADDAAVRIAGSELTSDSRVSFDSYSPSTGGHSNLAAGLAAAPASDLTIVVTDGVANAGGDAPEQALAAAVAEANRLKGGGSRIFAVGVGAADPTALAAITGGGSGSDVAIAGYLVGDAGAITAGLGALANEGCPDMAAADDGLMFGPMALVEESNPGAIAIPGANPLEDFSPASPYPSTLTVSGETGLVTDVDLHLFGLSHGIVQDIDMLLVGPTGASIIVMSDVTSGGFGVSNVNLTFDDSAAGPYPNAVVTGTQSYQPSNRNDGIDDVFPAPAPSPGAHTTLAAAFAGTDPNGIWQLFIVDDTDGDTGSISGGWSLTINTEEEAEATTTTVSASPNPSLVGGSVTFTAAVASSGAPVTSGTVTFTNGATTLASNVALNASGQASFTTSSLVEGAHTIVATYSGDTGLLTSTGSVTQVVDTPTTNPATGQFCNTGPITGPASNGAASPYPSRITVSGISGPITRVTVRLGGVLHQVPVDFDVMLVSPTGQSLVLMSDVGGQTMSAAADLTFADTGAAIPAGGPLVTGTYRPSRGGADDTPGPFPAPAPAVSAATTLAAFNGAEAAGVWQLFVFDDAGVDTGAISGGWCLDIEAAAPTTTTLTSSENPSFFGTIVTFTATVTSGGDPATGGTVTFSDGGTPMGSPSSLDTSGQATFTVFALTVGTHTITAAYNGTSAYQPSSSNALDQVVEPLPSQTDLAGSPNPSTFGESVTFTATVTRSGTPLTSGAVTFSDGATPLGPPVAVDGSGQATFTTSALTVGTHTIAAAYSGTATVATSDDSLSQVVEPVPSTTALTSSGSPSIVAEAVSFTATVTSGGSPATSGTVTFSDGPTPLATIALDASGQATFTTSALAVGVHTITAAYSGTATVAVSDDSLTHTIGIASSELGLTSSLNPAIFGAPVTFTASVTITSGGDTGLPATGSVTFTDATTSTLLGTVTLAGGTASVTTSALVVGTHTITAEYGGTTTVDGSDDTLVQVVDGVADAGPAQTIAEGESVTFDGRASIAGPDASFSWDVNGDGTFGDAEGDNPTLTWARLEELGLDGDGTLRPVTLRLTDGVAFTALTGLTITNVAPTASGLINDGPVAEGSSATVTVVGADDQSSSDAANLTYLFDYGDDGTVDETSSDPWVDVPGALLDDGPGTFVVSAVVADPDGAESNELTTTITITNAAATATIDGPSSAVVGEPVTIKVGAVDPSSADMAGTFLFTVDWGDGTAPITVPGPADPPVTHTYTRAGTFTVVATVVDPDGSVSEPLEFVMTVAEQVAPSTTTTEPGPTTTGPGPTTTLTPSTTSPSTSTTSPSGSTTTSVVAPALPATGTSSSNLALLALALLGAGGATVAVARRVRAATGGERDTFSGP